MGQPKLLLPWGNTSILGRLVEQWRNLGAQQFGVVCAPDSALTKELERLGLSTQSQIINPVPDRGMFSSVQSAAQWTEWKPTLTHFSIVLGDQPHIPEATLKKILQLSASAPDTICQPRQGGHRRHPIIMPREKFRDTGRSNAATLKGFLDAQPVNFCDLEDSSLAFDIDRFEDYERAKELYSEKKH